MKILALETSGKTFSVALNIDGQTMGEVFYDCGLIHSEKALTAIEHILNISQISLKEIDKFAVSLGPGSFTGIRVAMTVIKTMAQILNKPIVALNSLTILEKSCPKIKGIKIYAAINALRDEIFVKQGGKVIIKDAKSFANKLRKYKNKVLIIGDGAIIYKKEFQKILGDYALSFAEIYHFPKASVLAKEALKIDGKSYLEIAPLYIRKSWAEENQSKIISRL